MNTELAWIDAPHDRHRHVYGVSLDEVRDGLYEVVCGNSRVRLTAAMAVKLGCELLLASDRPLGQVDATALESLKDGLNGR